MPSEKEPRWSKGGYLSLALSGILRSATVLCRSQTDHHHFVARCGERIVVKAISTPNATEYETLKFLEQTSQTLLAPKPHGVIAVGKFWYMFMSFVPGVSLESVWRNLSELHKRSVSRDLNDMLEELHNIPFEHGTALGGLAGQGCKDTRRHTRTNDGRIYFSEAL